MTKEEFAVALSEDIYLKKRKSPTEYFGIAEPPFREGLGHAHAVN